MVQPMGSYAPGPADEPTFSISEVADMVGLSAHTIRAWERRYQALTPRRNVNNQRRYTMDDVTSLIRIKKAASARSLSLRLAAVELQQGQLSELLLPAVVPTPSGHDGYEADLWRGVVDLLPALVFLLDGEGRIADANLAVARAAGMVRSQLQELRFVDVVDPYDREKAVRAYRSLPADRRGWELNLRLGKLSGLHSFDCWAVDAPERLIVLIGRGVGPPLPRS
jgi:DNA-binding transcriptional MerR regulator